MTGSSDRTFIGHFLATSTPRGGPERRKIRKGSRRVQSNSLQGTPCVMRAGVVVAAVGFRTSPVAGPAPSTPAHGGRDYGGERGDLSWCSRRLRGHRPVRASARRL